MSVVAPQPSLPPPPTPSTADKAFNNGVYVIQPPPPAGPVLPYIYHEPEVIDDSSNSRTISPLMAALIATLAAAFVVLFYYTVISRFCRRRRNHRRLRLLGHISSSPHAGDFRADALVQDLTRPDTGLDDSFIRQITVFKYKRDDGMVEGTECAVCLSEFKELESLRLMPNCEHAFHIPCIDTWLQSHSNCPLCRSTMNPLPVRSGGAGGGGGGGVSVAAMQVQRGTETVLVVREVEERGQVRVDVVEVAEEECGGTLVISEERENKLDDSNNGR